MTASAGALEGDERSEEKNSSNIFALHRELGSASKLEKEEENDEGVEVNANAGEGRNETEEA